MTLRIYNTHSRRKEEFQPLQQGKVGIYVCGITAYDVCHVGHARSAVGMGSLPGNITVEIEAILQVDG